MKNTNNVAIVTKTTENQKGELTMNNNQLIKQFVANVKTQKACTKELIRLFNDACDIIPLNDKDLVNQYKGLIADYKALYESAKIDNECILEVLTDSAKLQLAVALYNNK